MAFIFSFPNAGEPEGVISSQQKQFEIARNVLFQDHCSGCCPSSSESSGNTEYESEKVNSKHRQRRPHYGLPEIVVKRGSEDVEVVIGGNVTLEAEVCANPPVTRVIWELPGGELLKGGQHLKDSLRFEAAEARNETLPKKPTCILTRLHMAGLTSSMEDVNNVAVIGINRDGFAEKSFRILVENNFEEAAEATPHLMASSSCDTNAGTMLLLSFISILLIHR